MFLYDSGKKVEIGVDAIKIQILKVSLLCIRFYFRFEVIDFV